MPRFEFDGHKMDKPTEKQTAEWLRRRAEETRIDKRHNVYRKDSNGKFVFHYNMIEQARRNTPWREIY